MSKWLLVVGRQQPLLATLESKFQQTTHDMVHAIFFEIDRVHVVSHLDLERMGFASIPEHLDELSLAHMVGMDVDGRHRRTLRAMASTGGRGVGCAGHSISG